MLEGDPKPDKYQADQRKSKEFKNNKVRKRELEDGLKNEREIQKLATEFTQGIDHKIDCKSTYGDDMVMVVMLSLIHIYFF